VPPFVLNLALFAGSLAVSWLMTRQVRRFALARDMLDVPNERSSHAVPTPRGGGIAIVVPVLATVALAGWVGELAPGTAVALGGGGSLIAAVGWLDDRRGVRASARALVHLVAACWAVVWMGGMPVLDVGVAPLWMGAAGSVLGVIGIMWMTNLFNFMDGIDGIAGGEAFSVALIGAAILLLGGSPGLASVALAIAGASAGFLAWNWAPARIFMGDVGSGFLGFQFGAVAVAAQTEGTPLLLWVLILGVFCTDATVTLIRRVARRQVWHAAHREHAYQRAVQAGWSHARVSTVVLTLNLLLGLLALLALRFPATLPLLAIAALALLGGVYRSVERLRPMS
jgi:Fuc2NAc and GlcNAc transferase